MEPNRLNAIPRCFNGRLTALKSQEWRYLLESLGNLSVVLIAISVPSRYFLVIQPFRNGTSTPILLHLIGASLKSLFIQLLSL